MSTPSHYNLILVSYDHSLSLSLTFPLSSQSEDALRDCIQSLRGENGYLTGELNDFRQRMALNEEQVAATAPFLK